jgi:hypothetical protein
VSRNLIADLDSAIRSHDVPGAFALAREYMRKHGQPALIDRAAAMLPLILSDSQDKYDAAALKFLSRWCIETGRTIDEAAGLAADLAEPPDAGPHTQAASLRASRLVQRARR